MWAPLLCVAIATGCQRQPIALGGGTNKTIPTVSTLTVEPVENAMENVSYFGRLVPAQQAELSFAISGRVATVNAEVGQTVRTGETLAAFDQTDLDSQRAALKQQQENESTNRQQQTSLQTSLQQLNAEAAQQTLTAPFDGVISKRTVNVGSLASPQRPAFTIVSLQTPRIEVDLPAKFARRLPVGQSLWTLVEGEAFRATLERKRPNVSASGLTGVTLSFTGNANERPSTNNLSLNQTVEIRFSLETENAGFWLPLSAVEQQAGGTWSVLVAKPTSAGSSSNADRLKRFDFYVAERRTVRVVQFDSDRALVAGSLRAGERVITEGAFRVIAGQRVRAEVAEPPRPTASAAPGSRPVSDASDPPREPQL